MDYPYLFVNYSKDYEEGKHYIQGSAPSILKDLIDYIESKALSIKEVYCCMYLYNNPILHEKMRDLVRKRTKAKKEININIISIPLAGYDDKVSVALYDLAGKKHYAASTKRGMALKIYENIVNPKTMLQSYKLYMFPHVYVRSKKFKNFSRGKLPYSLHAKGLFIRFDDGTGVTGILSSNLAVCDTVKNEIMVIDALDEEGLGQTAKFYKGLIDNSVLLTTDNLGFSIDDSLLYTLKSDLVDGGLFMAPFIKDSPIKMDERLSKYVECAEKRIYLTGQHIACDNGNDIIAEKPQVLKAIIKKVGENGVDVHCLSQTYVDTDENTHGQRKPSNPDAFIRFTAAVDSVNRIEYIVNQDTHAKFIVSDNIAIITTFNFTPTQFIYKQIDIDEFEFNKSLSYHGIFAEVGIAIVIKDERVCNQLISFYEEVKGCKTKTYFHKRRRCPKCNCGEMILRLGQYGFFLGCTSYPRCKNTQKIPLLYSK